MLINADRYAHSICKVYMLINYQQERENSLCLCIWCVTISILVRNTILSTVILLSKWSRAFVNPAESHSSVGLENRRSLVRSPARPIFFPKIDDSHYERIHSSPIDVHCFDDGYVGKQPVAWKEYCAEYWLKELQESMDRCAGRRDIT